MTPTRSIWPTSSVSLKSVRGVTCTGGKPPLPPLTCTELTILPHKDVYEKMNRALQGSTNIPEFGFTSLRRRPMLLCGQSSFQWVGKDDPDPYDPSGRTLQESQGANLLGWIGAWVYNHRYIVNGNDRDVMICRGSTWAVTVAKQDMVVFCDTAFRGNVPGTQSAVDGRDSVTEGKKLDDFGQFSLSRIMIHELAHWYGRNEMGTREGKFL